MTDTRRRLTQLEKKTTSKKPWITFEEIDGRYNGVTSQLPEPYRREPNETGEQELTAAEVEAIGKTHQVIVISWSSPPLPVPDGVKVVTFDWSDDPQDHLPTLKGQKNDQ